MQLSIVGDCPPVAWSSSSSSHQNRLERRNTRVVVPTTTSADDDGSGGGGGGHSPSSRTTPCLHHTLTGSYMASELSNNRQLRRRCTGTGESNEER